MVRGGLSIFLITFMTMFGLVLLYAAAMMMKGQDKSPVDAAMAALAGLLLLAAAVHHVAIG